jgi:crossover junction endodeoxyribonuclease RuvC
VRILGIDPGTATTGFGVVEIAGHDMTFVGAGVISTPSKAEMPQRLATIYSELFELISEYKPDRAAVELLYFAQNVMTVGQSRGVV